MKDGGGIEREMERRNRRWGGRWGWGSKEKFEEGRRTEGIKRGGVKWEE